jgi:hypothetical protein
MLLDVPYLFPELCWWIAVAFGRREAVSATGLCGPTAGQTAVLFNLQLLSLVMVHLM